MICYHLDHLLRFQPPATRATDPLHLDLLRYKLLMCVRTETAIFAAMMLHSVCNDGNSVCDHLTWDGWPYNYDEIHKSNEPPSVNGESHSKGNWIRGMIKRLMVGFDEGSRSKHAEGATTPVIR